MLLLVLVGLAALGYLMGKRRALGFPGRKQAHSLSGYHGSYVALWCAVPAILLLVAWLILEPIMLRSFVIGQLPEDQRTVLYLVAVGGHGYREVADMQDLPIGTITSRLARARQALKQDLEGAGP